MKRIQNKFISKFRVFTTEFPVHTIDHPAIHNLNHPLFKKITTHSDQVIFLINHSNVEYIYVSENVGDVLGHTHEHWMKRGISGMAEYIHPDDLNTLSNEAFPTLYHDLLSLKEKDRLNLKADYTFRIKNERGVYVTVLQHNIVLTIENNKVILGMAILTNITAFRKNAPVIYKNVLVSSNGRIKVLSHNLKDNNLITRKELAILELTAKGYSEKQAAEKLSVSINTIKTHKRNMMKKAGTANAAGLVRYGMANMLI